MRKNILKWLLIFMAVFQLIISSFTTAFAEEGTDTPTVLSPPSIMLTNGPVYEVNSGAANEIELRLKNFGQSAAYSVVIKPVISGTENPFAIDFKDDSGSIYNIGSRSEKTTTMILNVDKNAKAQTYTMTINYLYIDSSSKDYKSSDTIYIKVKNTSNPKISILDYTVVPENISAGDTGVISAKLVNDGAYDLKNLIVSLEDLDSKAIGIYNGSNTIQIPKLSMGESKDFSFNIVANPDMSSGNYPVTVKVAYTDLNEATYEPISEKFYVNVGGSSATEKGNLQIINLNEPSATFGVNENFPISFTLVNNGVGSAKNVKVSVAGVGEGGVVPKSTSIETIDELKAGESKDFQFMFAATSASKSQNYSIEITVDYEDGSKKEGVNSVTTFKQYAGANIHNPDADDDKDEKKSAPKIIISEYKCDPIIVKAGEEFDLYMTFLNTHAEKAVKNIKMFLTLAEETSSDSEKTGNIFTPVESSNTFYFDSIPPKGTATKSLKLYTVPDAQPKTYTLTVNFEYEDAEANEYKATELLGINVKQSTKLETGEIFVPETGEVGMPVTLSFDLYNTGKVTLNNLMVKLDGDIDTQNKSTYIGNFESGNSNYYEGSFTPLNEGDNNIKVTISYDDPTGEKIEDVHDFIMNATAPMPVDMGEGMGMDMNQVPQEGVKLWVIAVIAGGVIVLLIIIITILKKVKAKKEKAFLAAHEDDDDDNDTPAIQAPQPSQETKSESDQNDNGISL